MGSQGPPGNLKCNIPAKCLKANTEKQKACKQTVPTHQKLLNLRVRKHPAESHETGKSGPWEQGKVCIKRKVLRLTFYMFL